MQSFSVTPLAIPDVLLVQPRKFADHRGYFVDTYSRKEFARLGIANDFVQDNQFFSVHLGTVRGLHFQLHPQAKLVRGLRGAVYDVMVNSRRGSPMYGRWCSAALSAEEGNQLFIPRGFAHGFCTLEPNTEAAYKVDTYYECDTGLVWDDAELGIDCPTPVGDAVLSAKDTKLPRLADFRSPFSYAERT